jgi:hypothetical protein
MMVPFVILNVFFDDYQRCLVPVVKQTERETDNSTLPNNKVVHAVAQLVEALRYKPERRGFDSRWCHWNFSLT